MRAIKIFFSALITIALMVIITMSFASEDQSVDKEKIKSSEIELSVNAPKECCPDGWLKFDLETAFPEDPALKFDKNGDGYVCFRQIGWTGDDGPKGKGNDPLYNGNVKDNNNPCRDPE